jgi:hypothetical protein
MRVPDSVRSRLPRLLPLLGLVAAAGVTALAVVVVASEREEDASSVLGESGVRLDVNLSPEIVFFGDTLHAIVDVTVDRSRWDPGSVRVGAEFSPWEVIGSPTREQRESGPLAHVRTTYVLRCMASPCIPVGQASPIELGEVSAAVSAPGALEGQQRRFQTEWPLLVVYSRFASVGFEDTQDVDVDAPWRADLSSLPPLSYRMSPTALIGILVGLSLLLVVAAAVLAYVAWPKREPAPPPEPEPEPLPSLTPLEQALELLEESVRVDGAGDQRRALELVAEELDAYGDPDLAGKARVLAWSPDVPGVEQTNALAAQVRQELEQELLARAAANQNGDGSEE